MPFKSKAQQRFMFAAEARGELPKGKALEWAHETKNIKKLPERVKTKTAADIAKEIIDRIDVCAVDGGQARQQDQSFSVGGHHYVYPFIPENEVWIEKGNDGKDLSALIGHEVTERDMMKRQGLTYDQAHPIANHVEEAVRLEEGKQDGDTESEAGDVNNNKEAAHRSTLVEFFNKNPNPDDESFHAFAESKGLNKHKLEAEAYELATGHARFLGDGRAKEKSVTESDVDSGELSQGTEVETEHTPDRTTSKRIALDHLAEIPDYYKRLKKMEDSATSSEKKTASDIMALVAQRIYESEKSAENLSGLGRALRLSGDFVEEGADQYMRYRIRKKNDERYKLQEQHQSLPAVKTAGGANFPPISGPTSTSGITTSSQHEEKLKRNPPLPKPEDQPLASWDIDKVSSLIESLIPKMASDVNPAPIEDPQELYHKAVSADRRHKILSSTISGALSSGITSPIFLKQMGLSGGNLAKASLGLTGISALLGAATGGVTGMLSSRRSMKSIYDAEGMKGLHNSIKRHGLAETALAGGVGGLVGAGTSLLLRDRIKPPFQASENAALQSFGRAVPTIGEIGAGIGTSMGSTYAVDKIVDAMHHKQGNYYNDFPHNPEAPEVPADRYSAGRQGLLYLSSALHPFMAAPLAAATAHPGERFDQFGRALFGGVAGDVVGGLAGSFALGPQGFLLGSLLGRPAGTYIAQHVD